MKNFFKEFKSFAMKGNVMDLAIGVIIGAAFGKIVSSLVDNVLMPLIGALLGGKNHVTRVWREIKTEYLSGLASRRRLRNRLARRG